MPWLRLEARSGAARPLARSSPGAKVPAPSGDAPPACACAFTATPPLSQALGRAVGGAWRGAGPAQLGGGLAGISWFRRGGGGGSRERAPRQSRVPETGEGIGPGARWRLGRLRGLERRCLATGRSADARPRSRSASPCPRPPGHFCSARPRPDPRFHAVRVQNDAGKRVGVLGPGSVQGVEGGRAGSAEPVRLRASGL